MVFLNEKSQALFILELCTLHKPCNLTLTHRPGNKISSACKTQRPEQARAHVSERVTTPRSVPQHCSGNPAFDFSKPTIFTVEKGFSLKIMSVHAP